VRARIDEAPFAFQIAAAHQRVEIAHKPDAIPGPARFRVAQQLLDGKPFAEIFPDERE